MQSSNGTFLNGNKVAGKHSKSPIRRSRMSFAPEVPFNPSCIAAQGNNRDP